MSAAYGENEGFHILEEFVCTAIPDPSILEEVGLGRGEGYGQAIAQFRDASPGDSHRAFQRWRKLNPDGFFLNCRSSSYALLHRVPCSHAGDTQWNAGPAGSLTKHAKVCSTDAAKLRRWAADHGYDVSECQDCRP